MNWRSLFTSKYTQFLETELANIRKRHLEELETQKNLYLNQISSAITETNRAWGEVDRLRQYLIPNMPIADRSPQATTEAPTEMNEALSGTPFQRLLRKSYLEQEEAAKAEAAKKKETEKQNATSN